MCGKVILTQNRIPKEHYESEVGSQSSDFQAWVRREAEVVIGRREPEAECGKSVVWEMILRAVCFKGEEAGSWERDGAPTGGPAGGLGGNDGHGVNRRPGVGTVQLQQIKTGWPHGPNGQNRVNNTGRKLGKSPGNERRSGRGGSASRTSEDQSSTDPGGGPRAPLADTGGP